LFADSPQQLGFGFDQMPDHEANLKELVIRQKDLNSALDLLKGEQQVAEEAQAGGPDREGGSGIVALCTGRSGRSTV
jgi:hypothetical protein